jgi:CheY-like chemotaxis protein
MAMVKIPESNPAGYCLDQVVKAGYRARDLVRQILAFSRQTAHERKPIRVGSIAKEVLKFLRASLPSTIEIRQRMEAERDTTLADPIHVHQVLMNLCTNAHHAMLENGGVLQVEMSNVHFPPGGFAEFTDLQPGSYLKLGVSDTGSGISAEVINRIFEPYFTTKEKGVGTGLGLAVVDGIVRELGGAVRVQSELGRGSLFEVLFPLSDEKVAPEPVSTDTEALPRGNERILFVDDEEKLADMAKRMLEHLGYEVEVRTSSVEALASFMAEPERFDLVITDMTMPHMTGDKLARELLSCRSDIPIIICTGYSEQIFDQKAKEIGIRAFVRKPIAMREIAGLIRKVVS